MKSKNPLTDDNAHCIIKGKAQYLSVLRRNQGSHVQTPKWIKCTPEQMMRYMEDDRNGHLYGRHVVAAIKRVWSTAVCEGEYDMREEMSSFGAKLSFREMCVVLKEQKSWRQVRDFYYWMKLQLDRFIPNRSAMDFSSNVLSIALGSTVYLWDAADGSTSELVTLDEESGPVTSVKWPPNGRHIAIGLNNSEVQLWDSTANRLLRTLRGGHSSRVGALDWKNHILTTGGMDGQIINNDVSEGTRRRNLLRPSPRSLWALNY